MGLNNEYRFGALPTTNIPRSIFKMQHNWKGTFDAGLAIPIYVNQQIIPSDTYKIKQSAVIRMLTPIQPTMDDLVADVFYFSVPYRLVWDNFKKFMGENTSGAWVQNADLEIPQVLVPSTASGNTIPSSGSLWDYMGLPINIKGATSGHPISVSALPFRAYGEIINYFFRNQNLTAPLNVPKGDNNITYNPGVISYLNVQATCKLPDYYTTALPEPQKAPNGGVKLPLGTQAIVKTSSSTLVTGSQSGLKFNLTNGNTAGEGTMFTVSSGGAHTSDSLATGLGTDRGQIYPNNLYADLSEATAATINALRLAVQTQMIYERDGLFGTRYFDEILQGHFATSSGAAQYEKPEFLGAKRIPIQMNQVAQTSATDPSTSPQGNVAAFSLTADVDTIFTKSFTEHCILMGILTVRQLKHTSQQGISRQWSMKKRLDLLWHEYEHLGNQPIYNKEIYADGSTTDEEVFGYQERYAEYRYEENTICGEFRSTRSNPLDSWHYGDLYNSLPVLSDSWIKETKNNIQRTLAVQSKDQFMADITLYIKAIRPIKVFGTPGLVDHF